MSHFTKGDSFIVLFLYGTLRESNAQEAEPLTIENLTGRQKASILVIAIGTEAASQIFKHLKDKDVERPAVEIADMKDILSTIMEAVIEEFYQMIMAQEYISHGNIDYAKGVLEKAVGPRKAHEVISKVESAIHVSGFTLLKDVDPNQLLNFNQHEHPKTISLILANDELKDSIFRNMSERAANLIQRRT